ncbi:hypothetical protein H0H92_008108 [Tricholoma furcatifolium]|nr:hypothetical protein H0H92_008108 [Tricholoma furcatifolium]
MRWLAVLPLALTSLLLATPCLADDEMPCTIHHNGRYYDLNPLKSSRDYEFRTLGDHLFVLNVCRRPVKETFGLRDVDDANIAGFVRRDHGDFSIGAVNTTLSVYDNNLRLTLSGGSQCKLKSGNTEIRASTIVDFVCDTAVFETGEPKLVAQFPPGDDEEACGYFVQWRTHVACPTHEPGSAWGFFAVLIFIFIALALLYLVCGILYNRFVLNLRGMDQIPRFTLEGMRYHITEAVDWLRDLTGLHSSRYQYHIPRGEEEGLGLPTPVGSAGPRSGMNPVSHQTQVSSPPPSGAPGAGGGGGGSGAFVRPNPSRTPSGSLSSRKGDINPVSHQAQVQVPSPPSHTPTPRPQAPQQHSRTPSSQSQAPAQPSQPSDAPPPAPPKKEKPRPAPFDLGDDEEDDVGLGSATSAAVASHSQAAQERGRDLGGGGTIDSDGVIRL